MDNHLSITLLKIQATFFSKHLTPSLHPLFCLILDLIVSTSEVYVFIVYLPSSTLSMHEPLGLLLFTFFMKLISNGYFSTHHTSVSSSSTHLLSFSSMFHRPNFHTITTEWFQMVVLVLSYNIFHIYHISLFNDIRFMILFTSIQLVPLSILLYFCIYFRLKYLLPEKSTGLIRISPLPWIPNP